MQQKAVKPGFDENAQRQDARVIDAKKDPPNVKLVYPNQPSQRSQ